MKFKSLKIFFISIVFLNFSFLANAKKQSEIMKGEGDGQRNRIFANAFGKDPEFFAFYRAMIAYEKALIGGDTSLILSPDSDFFKFFGDAGIIKKQ